MKKIILLSLLLFCSIYAQDRHEVSLYLGGGYSALRYDPAKGSQSSWLDGQFGFGYAFFFGKNVGLATGLELAFYNAEFKLKELEIASMAKDTDGDDFKFTSTVNNYKEEQNMAALQIPLMLQLQTGSKNTRHFVMAGIKFAIPVSGDFVGKGDLKNEGCYRDHRGCFFQDQEGKNVPAFEKQGFGEFKGERIEGKEKFEPSFLASMEMGLKFRLQDGMSLYTGAYFDYGLNNILKKRAVEKMPLMIGYDEKIPTHTLNGIFKSQWRDGPSQEFTTKITPMTIGVKLRLALGLGVDYFQKKEDEAKFTSAEIARLEAEKLEMQAEMERAQAAENELKAQEAERLAAAQRLMHEARIAYDNAMREQEAMRSNSAEVARLAAEKMQLEREVARLAASGGSAGSAAEIPQAPPAMPAEAILQETRQSGEFAIQVAVMLEEARALAMVNQLKQNGYNAYYKQVSNPGRLTGIYYRVRIGYFENSQAAENFARTRLAQSYGDWWVDRVSNDTRGY
ncbi:MAG: outer membrane beta-barrel protein [Fibromonadaceae bacterium]|jgi:cell division septation protein DedD|nr:outer membrane beta-barrel protein [Fibromonadaceae bacterium]